MPAGNSGSWKRSNAKIVHHLFFEIKEEMRRKGGPQKIWDTQLCCSGDTGMITKRYKEGNWG